MPKDQKMYYIEEDIQKIQVKTNMYINEYGEAGAFHLAREIIQNSFDECLDHDSPGNTIHLSYDKTTDILVVTDNGRGFSEKEYPMKIFCTTLQSGSKFFRNSNASSAGEFGVGITVSNALSDIFALTSYRSEECTKHKLEFHEGIEESDTISKNTSGKHGTEVTFRVSKKYMGNNAKLPINDVIKWVESLFFLDEKRLSAKKIKCTIDVYKGLKLCDTYKFKPKEFSQLLSMMIPNNINKKELSTICSLNGDKDIIENSKTLVEKNGKSVVSNVDTEKHIHLDFAFQYCISPDYSSAACYDTYCNYTNTIDNGTHLDSFDEAFCRFIQNKAQASMSDSQKEKLKITWDDIRSNLFCVINLSTNAYVGFVGNAKTRIECNDLFPHLKEIISSALEKHFKKNITSLNEIIKIVKINAKARQEAAKVKTATQMEKINTFKEHTMDNYIRCNNTGKQWKELFLVEGNSASSGARNGSDPNTQAIFLLRGVVYNSIKSKSLADTMANKELHDLVTVLKCGIGDKFDINKLYFNRINIFTDADVDGFFISAGLLAFFYKHLRPIIEQGKLYKVFSPLYRLDDKETPYVANKSEMIALHQKKIVKNYKIKCECDNSFMDKDEMYEFLMDTYDYREDLIRAAEESGKINKFLVELIIAYLTLMGFVNDETDFIDIKEVFENQKNIKTIMSRIQKSFKEITVDNTGNFSGIADGKFTSLKVSPRFYRKTSGLIPVYKKYGLKLIVKEKDKEKKVMTIAEFLDDSQKYLSKIITRFKGLGELNGKQLRETTLDINHRISVQYTIDDVERELAIFDKTHNDSKKDASDRKEMMKKYKIRREDLDN